MHTEDRKNKSLHFDTVASMLAAQNVRDGEVAFTKRYSTSHTVGDGSGGEYVYDADSTATVNGGTVLPGIGGTLDWDLATGNPQSGSGTSVVLDAASSSTNDFYNGQYIWFEWPDVTGTLAAVGSQTSVTLGAGASATDDFYNGRGIVFYQPEESTTIASITSSTSLVLTAGKATDDAYNGRYIAIDGVDGAWEITDYVGSTKTLTVQSIPIAWLCRGDATADEVVLRGHSLVDGDLVRLTTTGTLPGGLSSSTDYYVVNSAGPASNIQLSLTEGGAAIDITDAGTGNHTLTLQVAGRDIRIIEAGSQNSVTITDYNGTTKVATLSVAPQIRVDTATTYKIGKTSVARLISDYVGSTKTATITVAIPHLVDSTCTHQLSFGGIPTGDAGTGRWLSKATPTRPSQWGAIKSISSDAQPYLQRMVDNIQNIEIDAKYGVDTTWRLWGKDDITVTGTGDGELVSMDAGAFDMVHLYGTRNTTFRRLHLNGNTGAYFRSSPEGMGVRVSGSPSIASGRNSYNVRFLDCTFRNMTRNCFYIGRDTSAAGNTYGVTIDNFRGEDVMCFFLASAPKQFNVNGAYISHAASEPWGQLAHDEDIAIVATNSSDVEDVYVGNVVMDCNGSVDSWATGYAKIAVYAEGTLKLHRVTIENCHIKDNIGIQPLGNYLTSLTGKSTAYWNGVNNGTWNNCVFRNITSDNSLAFYINVRDQSFDNFTAKNFPKTSRQNAAFFNNSTSASNLTFRNCRIENCQGSSQFETHSVIRLLGDDNRFENLTCVNNYGHVHLYGKRAFLSGKFDNSGLVYSANPRGSVYINANSDESSIADLRVTNSVDYGIAGTSPTGAANLSLINVYFADNVSNIFVTPRTVVNVTGLTGANP